MKNVFIRMAIVIGVCVIIPYFLIWVINKDVKVLFVNKEKIETYLPAVLFDSLEPGMHLENIKAHSVLMRSNLISALEDEKITYEILQKNYSLLEKNMNKEDKNFYKQLVLACEMTKGEVVLYESKVCYCPYFFSSNGTTRDAFDFFQDGMYPYVIAVPSHRDEEAPSYITYHYFSKEEFIELMKELSSGTYKNQIQILEEDESGYICWLKIGETVLGGEVFRDKLKLSSSCFTIEENEGGIRIACRGKGHGFGYSQYGANAMAVDGKSYKELIKYYFHDIQIENMYSFL